MSRITDRLDEVGQEMIECYRREIVDYGVLGDELLYGEVMSNALRNLRALIANLTSGELVGPKELEELRAQAARRVHQGISLESLLHSYRLWGHMVWQQILASAHEETEREAALGLAARVMEYVDFVSSAIAQAYLNEAQGVWSDREVVRRDFLETLLTRGAPSERLLGQAASLNLMVAENYVVVVARRDEHTEDREPGAERSLVRRAMAAAVEKARHHMRSVDGTTLVGMRQDEVVVLVPVTAAGDLPTVQAAAQRLAAAELDFGVGIGGWSAGLAGVPTGYAEAREAAVLALRRGSQGHAVTFEDVLVDHMLLSSPYAPRLVSITIAPLLEYDVRRGAQLVETLRTYLKTGFSLTRSAPQLHVHTNTVVYRLRRIGTITGYDPRNAEDVLLLSLGLKLFELGDDDTSPRRFQG